MNSPSSNHGSLVLVGGGEHAHVVADAARADGWVVTGYSDLVMNAKFEARFGIPYLGDDEAALRDHGERASFVLAVGTQPARARTARRIEEAGVTLGRIVHPRATVSPHARLEAGAVVLAGAVVNAGATVGAHVIVNTGAIIEHDVELGRLTHVCPGVAIGGGARLGVGVVVGLGACVRDHVSIGDEARIGMGAVVVGDVPAKTTVFGVPARAMGGAGEAGN